jgi:hypothetical protein
MARKLATYTTFEGVTYAPGEDAPEGIDNPAAFSVEAWQSGELVAAQVPPPAPAAEDVEPEVEASDAEPSDEELSAPPKAGPGSSIDAWRAYAESRGVDLPKDASRDEIIAAVTD